MSASNASSSRAWSPDAAYPGRIDMTDNTKKSQWDIPSIQIDDQSDRQDGNSSNPTRPRLEHTATQTSANPIKRISTLREDLARRRYSKYTEERYRDAEASRRASMISTTARRPSTAQRSTEHLDSEEDEGEVEESEQEQRKDNDDPNGSDPDTAPHKVGRLRRGSRVIRGFLSTKRTVAQHDDAEAAVDALYENQRGWFCFGLPLYSAASLLNFDPPPWANTHGEPSAVDTTNAQLPDPSWEWAWKTWYVDMSPDVDESGWQYSFMFQRRFSWHGTHPWFHSFVRRRRWIRKRVKKHRHLPDGRVEGSHDQMNAHKMTPEYFTIHSAMSKVTSVSYPPSVISSVTDISKVPTAEHMELDTIPSLIKRLKEATIDREKINAMLQYMDQSDEDSYYLADEMKHITSLFLFQHSRRHLLTSMIQKLDELEKLHQGPPETNAAGQKNSASSDEHLIPVQNEQEKHLGPTLHPTISKASTHVIDRHERLQRKIANLRRAAEEADKQIKQLEYWSDIREVVTTGQSAGGASADEGWGPEWQGVDASGPDPMPAPDKGKGKAV